MQNSYDHPVNKHWDIFAALRHMSLVQANPTWAGLVFHRRRAMSHRCTQTPICIFHYVRHGQLRLAYQIPIDVTAGRLLPQLTPGNQVPISIAG